MFKIITDNGSDLPVSFMQENDIGCVYLSTILDGEVINGKERQLPAPEFYRMLSDGAKPSTSQVNPEDAKEYFEEHINEADEFLYIGLSSGLSGTVGSVKIGAIEIMEKYPNKKIEVVDSLSGSLGEGLLVWYAVKLRNEGKSFEETAKWCKDNAKNCLLAITVDNLFDLWRGGRVSRSSAVLGTLASVKPFIIVDDEGKLQVIKKIRGRKKSLAYLTEYMMDHMGSRKAENDNMIMICHGDVPEDAAYVEELVKGLGYKNVMISNAGPMIGTHTGASLVIIAFLGDVRD
ncbi:MAG: DegV family protein [Lachnospiraceae bacterium]|nr:DegV family protein [Lachnospiraceae bacterium]